MGCNYFEKHFTIDKNMNGPDHKASLSIKELNIYVNSLKNIYNSLGNGIKQPSPNEEINKQIVRRSIVAKVFIKKEILLMRIILFVKDHLLESIL